ncbi:MAG: AbfB domain-containing protein [Spirochaetales bacterium]|nr:AbfB domain-containing protein [Spirochaetales bacterium]
MEGNIEQIISGKENNYMNHSLIKKGIIIILFFMLAFPICSNTIKVKYLRTSGPVIDGKMDSIWEDSEWENIDTIVYGTIHNENDLDSRYKVLFDDYFIYLIIRTEDDFKKNNTNHYLYNDSVSIFFDFGNEKSEQLDDNDYQFSFPYNQDRIYTRVPGHKKGISHKWAPAKTGYILEARIPIDDKKNHNDLIGFDIIINDVDTYYTDCVIAWSGDRSNYYSASLLGNLDLEQEPYININFGNKKTKEVNNYFLDNGQEYGIKPDGYTYGWEANAGKNARDIIKQEEYLIDSFIGIDKDNSWKIKLESGYYKVTLSLNDIFANYFQSKDVFINDKRYFYDKNAVQRFHDYYYYRFDPFYHYRFNKGNWSFKNFQLLIEDYIRITPGNPLLVIKKGDRGQAQLNYINIKRIDNVITGLYYPEDDTCISEDYRERYKSFGDECQILINKQHYFYAGERIGVFEFNLDDYTELENALFKVYVRNPLTYNFSRGQIHVKLFALKGYEFDENELTWSNCDFIHFQERKKVSLINDAVYLDEQDISGKNNTFISFNIKEYLLHNPPGKFTFIIMQENGTNEPVRLFSKEMGFNTPVVEVKEKKQTAVFEGSLTKDTNGTYILRTDNGNEYYCESHVYDLDEYLGLEVIITGSFSEVNNTIIVETIEVFPPEKVVLYANYWNNDGFPVWTWNTPEGAGLYRYKLNNSPWTETENLSYTPHVSLGEDHYMLYVQCRNRFSDWSEAASLDIIVDKTKPSIETITCLTPANNQNCLFSWDANDNYTTGESLFFEWGIDASIAGNGTTTDYKPENSLEAGWHTFSLKARDLAGNWSQSREISFYIDVTPPEIETIQIHYSDSQAYYSWKGTDDYSKVLSYEYSFNNTDWISTNDTRCFITTNSFDFFSVRARDEAGNWSEIYSYSAYADGLEIVHDDGVELHIPPESAEELVFINVESLDVDDTFDDHQVSLQSNIFHFSANPDDIHFTKDCELKIEYKENGFDESKLRIFRFNEETMEWEPQDTLSINTEENYITARINHFSYYAAGMSFFRVGYAVVNGEKKWCFLDQGGNPFYSTGVNSVNGTGHPVIRENIADYPENYPWDEEHNEPRYYDYFYQYVAALVDKYGPDDWQNEWFLETKSRLDDWNFNTLGPWGSYRKTGSSTGRFDLPVIEDFNMPYVMMLNLAKNEDYKRDKDVFSEEFDTLLEDEVNKSIIPERVNDPNLIGYYYVGEYDFGPIGYNATGPTISDMFYEYFARGEDHAGKHALIEFLKDFYHNDIHQFKMEFGLYFTHSGVLFPESHDGYPEIESFDDLLKLKATSDLQLALNDKENFIFILPIMITPADLLPDMKSIYNDVVFKYDAIINRDWDKIDQFRPDISDNYYGLKNLYLSIENLFNDYPEVQAVFNEVIFSDSAEEFINSLDALDEQIYNTIKSIDHIISGLIDDSRIGPLQALKDYLQQMQSNLSDLLGFKTIFNEIIDAYDKWKATFDYPDVRKEWMKFTAETYFRKCQQAIRAKDINHLILGTEFIAWATPVEVVKILGKYTDVVSVNFYNLAQGLPEESPLKILVNYVSDVCNVVRFQNLEEFYDYSGKPVMIGEFSFVSDENLSGCPNSQYRPLPKAETQEERAEMFEIEASNFIDSPYMIGYHWFEYADQPPEGRIGDGEDFNVGIVSINDEVYEELTAKMKTMNGKANDFAHHNVPLHPDDTIVSLINVLQQPPAKVRLQAEYWNRTGYPEWQWDQPAGAELYQYRLDDESWVETTELSFIPGTSLPEGSHTLTVRCKSTCSKWSEAASLAVMIDTGKPVITGITYEPQTHSSKARFTWTASDNYTDPLELKYEIRIDEKPVRIVDSPEYVLIDHMYEGSHSFNINAIDKAGNRSDVMIKEFMIDQLTFIDSIYTIEPELYPYHYAHITNTNGLDIAAINSQDDYLHSRFKIQKGSIPGENHIALESVHLTGCYIRRSGTDVIVSAKSVYDANPGNDPLFLEDSTFIIQPGLGNQDGFSLESYSSPGLYVKANDSDLVIGEVNILDPADCARATFYFTKKGNTLDLTMVNTHAEFEALTRYNLDLNLPIETTGKRYVGDAENANSHLFVKSCYCIPYYHGYEAVAGDNQGDYRIVIWKGDYDLKNDGTFINNTAAFFWSLFTQNQNKDDVGYYGAGAEVCVYKKKTYKIRNAEELLLFLPLEEMLTMLENLKIQLLDALGNIDVDLNDYIDDDIFESFPEINSDIDQFIFYYRDLFKMSDYELMRKIPPMMHGFEFRLDPSPNRIIQRIGEYLSDSDNMNNFLYEFIWVYAGNPIPAINNIMKKLRDDYPEDFEYTHYMPYSPSNFSNADPPLLQAVMVSKVDTVIDGDVIKKGDVIVADSLRTWWLNCWTGKDGHGQELQWDDVILYFKIEGFYNNQWQRWDHDQQVGGWGSVTDFLYIDL